MTCISYVCIYITWSREVKKKKAALVGWSRWYSSEAGLTPSWFITWPQRRQSLIIPKVLWWAERPTHLRFSTLLNQSPKYRLSVEGKLRTNDRNNTLDHLLSCSISSISSVESDTSNPPPPRQTWMTGQPSWEWAPRSKWQLCDSWSGRMESYSYLLPEGGLKYRNTLNSLGTLWLSNYSKFVGLLS